MAYDFMNVRTEAKTFGVKKSVLALSRKIARQLLCALRDFRPKKE